MELNLLSCSVSAGSLRDRSDTLHPHAGTYVPSRYLGRCLGGPEILPTARLEQAQRHDGKRGCDRGGKEEEDRKVAGLGGKMTGKSGLIEKKSFI